MPRTSFMLSLALFLVATATGAEERWQVPGQEQLPDIDDVLADFKGAVDASPVDKAQAEIEAIYKEHNPEKIGDVPRLLLKYAGREDMLVRAIKEKYKAGKAEKE